MFCINQELKVLCSVSLLFPTFIQYFDQEYVVNTVVLYYNNVLQIVQKYCICP